MHALSRHRLEFGAEASGLRANLLRDGAGAVNLDLLRDIDLLRNCSAISNLLRDVDLVRDVDMLRVDAGARTFRRRLGGGSDLESSAEATGAGLNIILPACGPGVSSRRRF